MSTLIQKYNVPGPRYTSYPTVPYWKNNPLAKADWFESIRKQIGLSQSREAAIYVHLPYCESLCTFCGCHKRITKNHAVEAPYIDAVLKEWKHYQDEFQPTVKELHLGGGTPTFFSPEQLKRLVEGLTAGTTNQDKHFGFEAHPNFTSELHLKTMRDLGFDRLSLGIQDYDPLVQKAIHRIQSFDQVSKIHHLALKMGYESISHDLVFGLPKQQLAPFMHSVELTISLRPDRVSLYSYAHVPWIKGNGQRGFNEADLPDHEEKRALYEQAKERFIAAGYLEIGMDHFALPHDDLARAFQKHELHRNFMGYTTQHTDLLIGLGVSAISDSWLAFAQNEKQVETYIERVMKDEVPIFRGHLLSNEDLMLRRKILDLMCRFETNLPEQLCQTQPILKKLQPLLADNLVALENNSLKINSAGVPFVRNVCMAFDRYLDGDLSLENRFSKVI